MIRLRHLLATAVAAMAVLGAMGSPVAHADPGECSDTAKVIVGYVPFSGMNYRIHTSVASNNLTPTKVARPGT